MTKIPKIKNPKLPKVKNSKLPDVYSIKKSMARHKKTSENIRKHNGIFIQNTDVIKEVADAFDNKYTFFD